MTKHPIRILLQTTIPTTADDWDIARFSLLKDYLTRLTDDTGAALLQVTARDREFDAEGNDPVLKHLDRADFDELWLFAVDVGDGITPTECAAISRFREQGGGLMLTRDHQDLGSSLCNLNDVGSLHYFHGKNPDPDPSRHCNDDTETPTISWPNYHSGRNGDCQKITPIEPIHDLLSSPDSPSGHIDFLPAHPHEGAVGVPAGNAEAQVVAIGHSLVSGRPFNLMVAIDRCQDEAGNWLGRTVAQSTFHHFCDYNWDTKMGCPSFVSEPPGDGMQTEPRALDDLKTYLRNLALWLAPIER